MMTDDKPENQKIEREQTRELVSSLADGQLRGLEFARAVSMTTDSGDARAAWHAYHVVGDVLRSDELASCADDAAFVVRLRARLQLETVGLASMLAADGANALPVTYGENGVADKLADKASDGKISKIIANNAYSKMAIDTNGLKTDSANESPFRWKLLAGVASVAAVGAIGWSMVGGLGGFGRGDGMREGASPLAAQLAQNAVQPQPQQPVMIRDPHLDALLAAHKQFGGTSALQMPAGFLRNATFESPAR